MKSGIYVIFINNKRYIGSAVNVQSRLRTHKANLRLNKHSNKYIQAAYNKYLDFSCYAIEYCEKDKLLEREQIWINYFNSNNGKFGYNLRKIPNSNLGLKFGPRSEKDKLKIGLGNKGKRLSKEHIEKIRLSSLGRKVSKELIDKSVLARKAKAGFSFSDNAKNKMSISNSKPNLWPCPNKSLCKCRSCLNLKNLQRRINNIREYNQHTP